VLSHASPAPPLPQRISIAAFTSTSEILLFRGRMLLISSSHRRARAHTSSFTEDLLLPLTPPPPSVLPTTTVDTQGPQCTSPTDRWPRDNNREETLRSLIHLMCVCVCVYKDITVSSSSGAHLGGNTADARKRMECGVPSRARAAVNGQDDLGWTVCRLRR